MPTSSRPASSLLDRLKIETRPIHQQLENDLDLLADRLSSASYCRTLEKFYGFYRPFEEQLFPLLPDELSGIFAARRKVPMIESDLRFFGIAPETLPLCTEIPKLDGLPAILGACYVTEGATLGGQVISRQLESKLGLADGEGYGFFRSYGPKVGSMWTTFRTRLLEYSSPLIDDPIVQAANDTFARMHRWLFPGEAVNV